jgi:hypothetical protein
MPENEGPSIRIICSDAEGEFCLIPLGGKPTLFAKVDPDDFPDISQFHWLQWRGRDPNLVYATRHVPKSETGSKRISEKMHRRIMKVAPRIMIDHKNRNGLDNRKNNLRVANGGENNWNQKRHNPGSSKYKGVCWMPRDGTWMARLGYHGKSVYLGSFKKDVDALAGIDRGEIKAARAYDDGAIKYFGCFACLNFPDESNILELKDGKYKMSYLLTDKDNKRIEKKIRDLEEESPIGIFGTLANMSIEELRDLCRYFNCNIERLAESIKHVTKTRRDVKHGVQINELAQNKETAKESGCPSSADTGRDRVGQVLPGGQM